MASQLICRVTCCGSQNQPSAKIATCADAASPEHRAQIDQSFLDKTVQLVQFAFWDFIGFNFFGQSRTGN